MLADCPERGNNAPELEGKLAAAAAKIEVLERLAMQQGGAAGQQMVQPGLAMQSGLQTPASQAMLPPAPAKHGVPRRHGRRFQ